MRQRSQLAWWQRGAIYQIYPRSFADSDGEGVGDLPGVLGRLDPLVALGVSALWLSPFYRSPMADVGYDVSDYCDVDPVFGTLADFDALLKAAHERGLRVLVDWVPNHTSDRHAWFQGSGRGHWYVWRNRPNGWRAQFRRGGPAWRRDEDRDQWYLHSFLPQQSDLNWDEPEVEAAMHDVCREFGVAKRRYGWLAAGPLGAGEGRHGRGSRAWGAGASSVGQYSSRSGWQGWGQALFGRAGSRLAGVGSWLVRPDDCPVAAQRCAGKWRPRIHRRP
jgi:hypothetical protein